MLEGVAGGGGLAVGEERETEFDVMRKRPRGEFDGALEMADGVGGGGGWESAVDQADQKAFRGAERGDFVVPAAEDVMRVVVSGIEGEGFFDMLANEAGVFDARAGVGVEPEFSVANGEGEDVDGIGGGEGDGALGVGKRFGAEAFFLGGVGRVVGEVGVLAGNFLENEGVVGARGVGAEVEIERGAGVETRLGGLGVGKKGNVVGVGRECGDEGRAGKKENDEEGEDAEEEWRVGRRHGGNVLAGRADACFFEAMKAGAVPRVEGVVETILYVEDLARAVAFYRDVMGLRAMTGDGERFQAFDVRAGQVLLLFKRGATLEPVPAPVGTIPPHDGRGPLHVGFAIAAESYGAWRERLAACEVTVESETAWERGGRSLYFRDPDGHLVELITPGIWENY